MTRSAAAAPAPVRWGVVLGLGLGGFFDGILLHQILQWHHLLSLVPEVGDLRALVLWDGVFHAAMYALAGLGLWGLWRAHRAGRMPGGRALLGALLLGFGLWHALDGVLSHWVLGLHRIRIDSANPLAWDIGWLLAFGLLPMGIGWRLMRGGGGGGAPGRPALALLGLLAVTAAAGAWSLGPSPDRPFTVVVFRPGIDPAQAMGALAAAQARLVWARASTGLVVAEIPPGRRWGLHGCGALLVGGAGLPAGCLGWSRA